MASQRDHHTYYVADGGHRKLVLWQMFCGLVGLSRAALASGRWDVLQPLDIMHGVDLADRRTQLEILRQLDEHDPDFVSLEPPCNPWSPLQNLSLGRQVHPRDPEALEELRAKHLTFWKFAREVWLSQERRHRLCLIENPWRSAAWGLKLVQELPNASGAKVAQCMSGLRDPISGLRYQKLTRLEVNDTDFAVYLEKNMLCTHTSNEHEPLEGHLPPPYSCRRTTYAGAWTVDFGRHVIRAAELTMRNRLLRREYRSLISETLTATPEDAAHPGGRRAHASELNDEGMEETCGEDRTPTEAAAALEREMPGQPADTAKAGHRGCRLPHISFQEREGLPDIRTTQLDELAKLHDDMAHAPPLALARHLRLAGAATEAVAWAKQISCDICDRFQPPGMHHVATFDRPRRFNEVIGDDCFMVVGPDGQRWWVYHVVDHLTTFHVGALVETPSGESTAEAFETRWLSWAGPPTGKLMHDAGREHGGAFRRLLDWNSIASEPLPTEAQWKNGVVERHGAVLKFMLLKVMWEIQCTTAQDVQMALTKCCWAKNRLARRAGLSPCQAVLGHDVVVPASIMDNGHQLMVQEAHGLEESLRRAERMRELAIRAFTYVDSDSRLRRALATQHRPPRRLSVAPGMQVMFWNQQRAKLNKGPTRRIREARGWHGPAVAVAADGPNCWWVKFRSTLYRIPVEMLRDPTGEEMCSFGLVLDELNATQRDLEQVGRGCFRHEGLRRQEPPGASEFPQPEPGGLDMPELERAAKRAATAGPDADRPSRDPEDLARGEAEAVVFGNAPPRVDQPQVSQPVHSELCTCRGHRGVLLPGVSVGRTSGPLPALRWS